MKQNDFSKPRRMSRGAFPIIACKTLKQFSPIIFTTIICNLLNSRSVDKLGMIGSILLSCALCLVMALIVAFFSYYFKKFYISEGNLVVIHSIFNRETTSIPLDRIHSLRTKKGILYRIFDMRGIIFDTLASRHEELELILSESDWKHLLKLIDMEEHPLTLTSDETPETDATTTMVFPATDLILAALCQNHLQGMAVFGSFLMAMLGNLSDLPDGTTDKMADWLENLFESITYTPLGIIFTFTAVYLLILFIWIGRTLLRYADMTMTYNSRLLTFTHGLFTRSGSRFYFDKICTIWIKRNFLERKFGFSTVMLRQALNASVAKEKDQIKLYGADSTAFFLDWWLGKDYASEPTLLSAQSGRGLFLRSLLFPLILTIAASVVLSHFHLYLWLLLPLGYLFISIFKAICTMRHSRIELKPSYIIIHSGAFAEISSILKYSNIEVVRIRRTPLTPRTHRVTLILSTSGTTFYIRSLSESEALKIYERILSYYS